MAEIHSNKGFLPDQILLIDKNDSNNIYVGTARPNTATSASTWQIKKLVTSGGNVSYVYADGSSAYNKIWDNRAGYSYS